MRNYELGTISIVILFSQLAISSAQESGSGLTRRVRTPITSTQYEEREQTVYREPYSTEVYESQRNVLVPVTEYEWQPRWHGVLNPFRPATLAYDNPNSDHQTTMDPRTAYGEGTGYNTPH